MTITKVVVGQTELPETVQNLRRVDRPGESAPTCSLTTSATTLPSGGTAQATITWTTTFATQVTLNGGTVTSSGSLVVQPLTDATYTLTAYGDSGTTPSVCQKVIHVTQPTCANGAICPVTCGTGMIPDVKSGTLLSLPPDRMIHVLIVAEGYTSTDIARFHTDVDNWMVEWSALDVYDTFREAFCIWKLPAVSSQRIVPGGTTEDTAFRVPVDSGGDVDLSDPLAMDVVEQRVWTQVARLPFPPATFYPTTASRTRGMAKNLVVAGLLYEAAVGRAGYDGQTGLLVSPSNSNQSVAGAWGLNRPHEFTHAFTRLRDEYISLDGTPSCQSIATWNSGNVSNVVCGATCSSLPWKHLIVGGAVNVSVTGLVGAFGIAEEGYHSELKCLMNGDRSGNATVFGGETELRDEERMCNFCRELTVFRLFERIGQLPDTATSYATWQSTYRGPFYATYGMDIPAVVPMETPPGRDVYRPCTP